jgi:integrase
MGRPVARTLNRLSAIKVSRAKAKGLYADGGGLYLRVADGGSKGWVFRFVVNGRLRDMGLGPTHTLSLAEAREAATGCRKLRLQGIDPIERRRSERAAERVAGLSAMTFRQCADAFIASHESGWDSPKHRQQWVNTLAQHVHPVIGGLPVHAIDTPLVLKVIEPLWTTIPETASRIRGRIESVLDWARVRSYRAGENPARWRGHLDHLLPARSKVRRVEHHAALPYDTVGAFMAKLREESSIAARALEFLILTAARLGEVRGATWSEIDLRNRLWTVPPARMKAKKEHRVPLSDAAIAVLKRMHNVRHSDLVFPGTRAGKQIAPMTALLLVKRLADADVNVHGFRSTFRDWVAERSTFPSEVAELALAHAVGDKVEAAYRRGDLFEKRRKLMDAWATFLAKPSGAGAVTPIRAVRS